MAGLKTFTVLALAESLVLRSSTFERWDSGAVRHVFDSHWTLIVALLAVNHLVLFTYSSVIYPRFLSPLRRLAKPKVSTRHLFQNSVLLNGRD
jgi:hypothetical protein